MNRFRFLASCVLFVGLSGVSLAQADQPQYRVTTYAGNPGGNFADGFGSRARFGRINGIATDKAGNVYVADCNYVVRKIGPNGLVTTLAGLPGVPGYVDGTGNAARFGGPNDIAVDSHGTLYVADFSLIRKISPDGAVSTFAGAYGSSGIVDGVGTAARFMNPLGLAIDASDNLYVADTSVVRKITPDGTVTTLTGIPGQTGVTDGPPGTATLEGPLKIAVAADGTLYLDDQDRIRKISPTGVVSTLPIPGPLSVEGLCVGSDGALYFTQFERSAIFRFNADGSVSTFSGNADLTFTARDGSPNSARFYNPGSIALSTDGSLFVADAGTVRSVSPAGWVSTVAGLALSVANGPSSPDAFVGPRGLAIDGNGNVYVSDAVTTRFYGVTNGTIRKIAPDGTVTILAGPGSGYHGSTDGIGTNASFYGPQGVAVDAAGNVFVADSGNATIRKITPAGVVTTFAGTAGVTGATDGPAATALFNGPVGLAFDRAGNLFIADGGNRTIRKLSPAGIVTTFAGQTGVQGSTDGPASQATFGAVSALAIDVSDNLYVVDSLDCTVRKIGPDGTVTTLAGSPGVAGYADGVGSAALFNHPTGVGVDRDGNVFVADTANNVLRWVTPAGVVTTIAGVAGKNTVLDGVGSAARVWNPSCVAVDASGDVFFGDDDSIRVANRASAIVAQPQPAVVEYGTPATLSVSAAPATSYQWYVNGAAIAGATSASVQVSTAGMYSVDVLNGVVPTHSAVVPVSATSDLRNVSGRASVQTGDNVAIVGFVLAAPTGVKKQVLIRGAGPALAKLGVAAPAMNPVLTLFDASGGVIGTGAAWGSAPTAGASSSGTLLPATSGVFQRAGAFSYDPNSADSAFVATLPAGAYTATCAATSGGVGLTEVYALDMQDGASLTNLSVRGYVSSEPMIEGFVSTGSAPAKFLIRGVGPTLGHLNVSSPLPKPVLTLCDAAGHVVASNSGWQNAISPGDSPVGATMSGATNPQMISAGAFPLDPGSADCAMIVTLPPGPYSAILTPGSGTNGTGLLELYRLNE